MLNEPSRSANFLTNVLWSWSGVAVNLFGGFFLSPFLIRKLGVDNFGIWTLVLAMVENYWLLDFGFRNATLKYTAHYRALDDPNQVNGVLSTAIFYSSLVSIITIGITLFARSRVSVLFNSDQPIFATLVLIVGISWSIGIVFNVFNVALEGFQRFDITSRLWIISSALRTLLMFAVVLSGRGLREMALVLLFSQLFVYLSSFISFRRVFPKLRISPRFTSKTLLKEMAGFASHNFAMSMATRVLMQSAPLFIGVKLPPRFVAFFTVPQRLLDYPADAVGRVGNVSGSTAAELYACGDWAKIKRLVIWTNRYCAALYAFLVVYLLVYGRSFVSIWLTPQFGEQSAKPLSILLVGALAVSSQYNSATVLVHIGGHKWYARLVMAEATLFLIFVPLMLSLYGLIGAAAVISFLALLGRGIGVSYMTARKLEISYGSFLAQVYLITLAISAVVFLILYLFKTTWLPGTNWLQLVLGGTMGGLIHLALTIWLVLSPEHRQVVRQRFHLVKSRFGSKSTQPA